MNRCAPAAYHPEVRRRKNAAPLPVTDGTLIDGAQGGNATRHLNHACEPNCEAIEEYAEDGQLTVRIETIKTVPAGAEMFLDYALDIDAGDHPSDYPCRCGLARCRGTLVAPVEL